MHLPLSSPSLFLHSSSPDPLCPLCPNLLHIHPSTLISLFDPLSLSHSFLYTPPSLSLFISILLTSSPSLSLSTPISHFDAIQLHCVFHRHPPVIPTFPMLIADWYNEDAVTMDILSPYRFGILATLSANKFNIVKFELVDEIKVNVEAIAN